MNFTKTIVLLALVAIIGSLYFAAEEAHGQLVPLLIGKSLLIKGALLKKALIAKAYQNNPHRVQVQVVKTVSKTKQRPMVAVVPRPVVLLKPVVSKPLLSFSASKSVQQLGQQEVQTIKNWA